MDIFFGTNNPNKLREVQEMLGPQFRLKSFKDLEDVFDVEETETTLEGNAALKARAFHDHTGLACFSDDSGLEVEALDGAPGVYSARYGGPGATATINNNKLLHALEGEPNRKAQFRAVIAYCNGETMKFFEGKVEGKILLNPVGDGGFGYDPIFQPDGYDISFAEMDTEEKHRISHRGKAIRAFVEWLKSQ